MKRFFLLSILGLTLLGTGVFYTVFFSPIPLQFVQKGLEAQGFRVTGLTGNLNAGFSFEELSKKSDTVEIEVSQLKMHWSNLYRTYVERELILENLTADRMLVHVKDLRMDQEKKEKSSPQKEELASSASKTEERISSFFKKVGIEQIRVKDFAFKLDFLKTHSIEIPLFEVSNFFIESDQMSLSLAEIDLKNIAVMVSKAKFDPKKQTFQAKTNIRIQPSFDPHLKKEIAISLQATQNTAPFELKITAFGGALSGDLKQLELKEFTPSDWFQLPIPLEKVSAVFVPKSHYKPTGVTDALFPLFLTQGDLFDPHSVQFKLGQLTWVQSQTPPPEVTPLRAPASVLSSPQGTPLPISEPHQALPTYFFTSQLTPQKTVYLEMKKILPEAGQKWLKFTSAHHLKAEDFLAEIYFNQPYSKLTPTELQTLTDLMGKVEFVSQMPPPPPTRKPASLPLRGKPRSAR